MAQLRHQTAGGSAESAPRTLNSIRLLTRVVPYLIETEAQDPATFELLWGDPPGEEEKSATPGGGDTSAPLARRILHAVGELLFSPAHPLSHRMVAPPFSTETMFWDVSHIFFMGEMRIVSFAERGTSCSVFIEIELSESNHCLAAAG